MTTYDQIAKTRKELLSYVNQTRMDLNEIERKKRYLLLRKGALQAYGYIWGIHFGEDEYGIWEEYENDEIEQEIERRITAFLTWIESLQKGDTVLLHFYNGNAPEERIVLWANYDTIRLTQGVFSFDKITGHDFTNGAYITPLEVKEAKGE